MFLGAGSVMHGMDDQVNMRGFGRLSGAMKITWITFGVGWLAILGVPPFAGFWSKDKIIEARSSARAGGRGSSASRRSSARASRPSTCRVCSS